MPTSSFDKEFVIRTEKELEHFLNMVEKAKENPLIIERNKDLSSRELTPERIKEIIENSTKKDSICP